MFNKLISLLVKPRISIATFLITVAILISTTWYIFVNDPLHKRLAALGVAPLGTEVVSDIMSLQVESVREDSVGALPFVPHEGNTFIIPTIVIRNLSSTTRDLIPTLALYIKDSDGNIYNMAVAPLRTEEFGGPILPNDKVRQEMAFEVKKNAKNLVFYFETGGRVMAESLKRMPW